MRFTLEFYQETRELLVVKFTKIFLFSEVEVNDREQFDGY